MISEATKVALQIARVAIDKATVQHMLANPSLIDIRYAKLSEQEIHNAEAALLKTVLREVDTLLET